MANFADSALTIKIDILPNSTADFASWQAKFREQISQACVFSSLEILSTFSTQSLTWFLNLRFNAKEYLEHWLNSSSFLGSLCSFGATKNNS